MLPPSVATQDQWNFMIAHTRIPNDKSKKKAIFEAISTVLTMTPMEIHLEVEIVRVLEH